MDLVLKFQLLVNIEASIVDVSKKLLKPENFMQICYIFLFNEINSCFHFFILKNVLS